MVEERQLLVEHLRGSDPFLVIDGLMSAEGGNAIIMQAFNDQEVWDVVTSINGNLPQEHLFPSIFHYLTTYKQLLTKDGIFGVAGLQKRKLSNGLPIGAMFLSTPFAQHFVSSTTPDTRIAAYMTEAVRCDGAIAPSWLQQLSSGSMDIENFYSNYFREVAPSANSSMDELVSYVNDVSVYCSIHPAWEDIVDDLLEPAYAYAGYNSSPELAKLEFDRILIADNPAITKFTSSLWLNFVRDNSDAEPNQMIY